MDIALPLGLERLAAANGFNDAEEKAAAVECRDGQQIKNTQIHTDNHTHIEQCAQTRLSRLSNLLRNTDRTRHSFHAVSTRDHIHKGIPDHFRRGEGTEKAVLDNVSYRLKWKKELSEIPPEQEYRLKFDLFRADVYSYTLEDVVSYEKDGDNTPYIVGADKESLK